MRNCYSQEKIVHSFLVAAQSARLRERPTADVADERTYILVAHVVHDQTRTFVEYSVAVVHEASEMSFCLSAAIYVHCFFGVCTEGHLVHLEHYMLFRGASILCFLIVHFPLYSLLWQYDFFLFYRCEIRDWRLLMRSQLLFHLHRVGLIPVKEAVRCPFSFKNLPKSLLCTSLEHTAKLLAIQIDRGLFYSGLIRIYLSQFTLIVKLENWSPIFLVRFCRLNFVQFWVKLFDK